MLIAVICVVFSLFTFFMYYASWFTVTWSLSSCYEWVEIYVIHSTNHKLVITKMAVYSSIWYRNNTVQYRNNQCTKWLLESLAQYNHFLCRRFGFRHFGLSPFWPYSLNNGVRRPLADVLRINRTAAGRSSTAVHRRSCRCFIRDVAFLLAFPRPVNWITWATQEINVTITALRY